MKYDASAFATELRELRKERGLTQEVLSGLANIARSHLAMIETGEKVASVETLWKITNALDMPLSVFIRRVEDRICSSKTPPPL